MERLPLKIDIGAVYNSKPKHSRKLLNFHPMERELVFDIDMTDYDEVRTCCKGTSICKSCWLFMVVAAKILYDYLRQDFGFKHMLWVFSGRRGIHCWVADERARKLSDDLRDAVVCFINVIYGGEFKSKKVSLKSTLHPSIERSVWHIDRYFDELMIQNQKFMETKDQIESIINLCTDSELRAKLKELHKPSFKDTAQRWAFLQRTAEEFYSPTNRKYKISRKNGQYLAKEIKLQLCFPRLDINVSKGLNHLLKVPFSIHPKTGRVCVPIDFSKIDDFDPFSVPTIQELCMQMDKIDVPASGDAEHQRPAAISLAAKTSLAPYLKTFDDFVSKLVEN